MEASDHLQGRARRARDWVREGRPAICDVITPWEHGTFLRASEFPDYYEYNHVRVETDPGMGADELIAVADAALAAHAHRRLDFEVLAAAQRVRAEFAERGWMTTRLLWMLHVASLPPGRRVDVVEVQYDAVEHLRAAWHSEDYPDGTDQSAFKAQAREVAMRRGGRVLAVAGAERPIAFAELVSHGGSAEISQIYVHPAHRGAGLGTSLTAAAVELAGEPQDLWICADDEDRPKDLYARLGFRGVWRTMTFERVPGGT